MGMCRLPDSWQVATSLSSRTSNKMKQILKQNRQQYEVQAKPERVYQTVEVRTEPKIGRNDPCPCGSGKKYKKCCGA